MDDLLTTKNLIALVTLTGMEIVLGIDNVVFIAILAGKLDPSLREKARKVGLALAMVMRILLLLGVTWIARMDTALFTLLGHGYSGRDLILLAGGLFLIGKATFEIHHKMEGPTHEQQAATFAGSFRAAIVQIVIIDMVFSIDSVITAVGMADSVVVMIIAVILAVAVMMVFAGVVSSFIEKHPTLKMLALSFLLLIGVMLVVEGVGQHFNRGYIYFAMGFSLGVEMLNMRVRKRLHPQAGH
ncbi:MAG: TerC family protein [Phycisphaerales bacterium]|nr:TerC family protein [Phycisphaerales bacterium]